MSNRRSYPRARGGFLAVAVLSVAVLAATTASKAVAAPTIRFKEGGLDRFKFHGRVKLDPPMLGGPVDPLTAGFGVQLSNEYGVLYYALLLPGDLQPRANLYYEFRDSAAPDGNGTRNGLFQVITRFREYADGWYYTVRILAFTDLSAAVDPLMTVIFDNVDRNYAVTAEWVPTQYGWRLPLGRFEP